jgi:protease I
MMNGRKKLAGLRIAVLVTDGFEQVELSAPLLALREAGAEADIISLHTGNIRGVNLNEPADDAVAVDKLVTEVRARDYDGLFIPGGFINPDLLRQSSAARDLVREFDHYGKPIATLCHGPWLIASSGLAAGRAMTSWPGVRDDLVNAGATWLDQKVVRDGNLLSSRGPQDIVPFVREMIQLFTGAPPSNGALRRRASDPQRDEPATFAAAGMRVMPNLSVSTMLGMALLSAGAYAVRRGMRGGGTEGGPR